MTQHPAFADGNAAVVTGGGDGIGLAAVRRFAGLGMKTVAADIDGDKLADATRDIDNCTAVPTDVSQLDQVERLCDRAYDAHGRVDVLMNNAGTGRGTGSWRNYQGWQDTFSVNMWGVINGCHTFVPKMIESGAPGLVINTGSKQGITCPPGDPAYNASKAAIKAITEALAHDLRGTENCQIQAHLLVPGFTYTGMMRAFLPEKPESAWTSEQVADFIIERINAGDFYILCPDNDVDRATDNKRMQWAMGDLIENRPALSRWHPDYEEAFAAFMKGG